MLKKLFSPLVSSSDDPSRMKGRQWILTLFGGLLAFGLIFLGYQSFSTVSSLTEEGKSEKEKLPSKTPPDAVNPQEIWAKRIEKAVEKGTEQWESQYREMKEQHLFIREKVDLLESLMAKHKPYERKNAFSPSSLDQGLSSVPQQSSTLAPPSLGSEDLNLPSSPDLSPTALQGEDAVLKNSDSIDPVSSRYGRISLSGKRKVRFKHKDTYIPCGTYAKAVLTSGMVTSTTVGQSAQPRPIILRLVDDGHLPQGFKGVMNNNVLIGECHADLSSERVFCTLSRMSWVEEDGTTVEKMVQGWVIGEDGRPGLRGEVVDRSIDAVKDTFIAGLLSGVSNFLKFDATNPAFTPSLTERGSTLQTEKAAKAAASSGVGNALDKLVDYSIKRAEQLQPVIQIASGRVVDIVFKDGIDTRPDVMEPLKLVTHTQDAKENEVIYDKEQ